MYFSFFENIDFNDKADILSAFILLILVILIILLILWAIIIIIKMIERLLNRLLNIEPSPKLNQKNANWLHKKFTISENGAVPKKNDNNLDNNGNNIIKDNSKKIANSYGQKTSEKVREDIEKWFKKDEINQESKITVDDKKISKSSIFDAVPKKDRIEVEKDNSENLYDKKMTENISAGLSKLKADSILGKGIESRMPSLDKSGAERNLDMPLPTHNSNSENNDGILFNTNKDVNRRVLTHELEYGKGKIRKEIYKAQRELNLNLSAKERGELIKKYLPKYYGQNISKEEMRGQLYLIQRDSLGTGAARVKAIKEIKFLKKISGIK